MKLRIFLLLISLDFIVAQDVVVPEDLLKPKTTTPEYEDETLQHTDIETTTEIKATTTKDYIEDTTKGSLDLNPNNPKSDQLTDNKLPLYVYPQYPNFYPNYLQNPQYETPNCNQNTPSYPPVVIPPIYESKTVDPEIEENIECPIGFIKSELTCIPLHSNNCPLNYVFKDEKCVLSQTVCPLNFEYDGTSCVERQVCPPNHVWEDGKCKSPEPQCPSDWQWNGETCKANVECPSGFILKGKECIFETIICPNGFTLVNEKCEKPSICMPGYELQESGFCIQINKRCPPGTVMVNEKCQETTVRCLPGYEKIGNQCYKIVEIPTIPPPSEIITTSNRPSITHPIDHPPELTTESIIPDFSPPPLNRICPSDFIFYNGQCYRCPADYSLCNGMCLRKIAPCRPNYPTIPMPMPPNFYPNFPIPNINIHLNIPNHDIPKHSPSSRSDMKPINIINHIEPINNTIHNINNITHPVTLNNVNENNIYVYTDTQCADGKIRTTIIKNNQTIMGCDDNDSNLKLESTTTKEPVVRDEENAKPQKCCEIVTPR